MKSLFKYLSKTIFTLSLIFLTSQFASALNVCPDQPVSLIWSTQGTVTSCPTQGATGPSAGFCNFQANSGNNYSGNKTVTLTSGSCTVNFQCENTPGVSSNAGSDTLNVVNGAGCCGLYGQSALTVWNGSACVAPLPTINVTREPRVGVVGTTYNISWTSTGATSVRYDCDKAHTGSAGVALNSPVVYNAAYRLVELGTTVCIWTATNATGQTATQNDVFTVNCNTGFNLVNGACVASACANGATNPTVCTLCPAGQVMNANVCVNPTWTRYCPATVANGGDPLHVNQTWEYSNQTPAQYRSEGAACCSATGALTACVSSTPTISVTRSPAGGVMGTPYRVTWTATNATNLTFNCVPQGTGGYNSGGPRSPGSLTGFNNATYTASEVGTTNCTWTATNAIGQTAVGWAGASSSPTVCNVQRCWA